jgi:hypothetical protein
MRRIARVWVAAALLAALGCSSGSPPNPGPPIEKNPKGPGPMKPPGEGPPSLPPKEK